MVVTLSSVVPWGRTMSEYSLMFGLYEQNLDSSILGCGDGPASFNSEMTGLGRRVVSVDPIYSLTGQQIEQRIAETYETIIAQCKASRENYVWSFFSDPDELGRHRLGAMRIFLEDFERGLAEGRYLAEELPRLSFRDGEFDLALCSHFLFLYTEQLSLEFHVEAIREMCRVAREVRIFPLLDLKVRPSVHVEPVISGLRKARLTVEIVKVPYEFQRGGDEMMKIQRNSFSSINQGV
jgi:hypothetical protein